MNKDLYEILGVSRDASESEIKSAYKRLSLKYHPDRQGGKNDKEKKEAEEKFKEVNMAYSTLSDPQKKQQYDMFGVIDGQANEGGMPGGGFDPFDMMNGMFSSFFGGGNRRSNRNSGPQNGASIQLVVEVSIDEIFNGINRDVEYEIEAKCDSCNGKGGEGVETCPHCHGTGMFVETHRSGFSIIQNQRPCPYCNATGQIVKHKCSKCNGTGKITKKVKVRIQKSGGIQNGETQLYRGMGYESTNGGSNGDLQVIFQYNFDTKKYGVKNGNFYEYIDIPYYDCILGCDKEVELPNHKKKTIHINEYSDNMDMITLKGEGLNRHDYIYVIHVKMPKYVREDERKLLRELKSQNK